MTDTYNVYCDESGHLEHDQGNVMVLGAVWCRMEKVRLIARHLRGLRASHGLASEFEIKWGKVSPSRLNFYLDVMDYFFDEEALHFRALIVPDKSRLNHQLFNQTHDEWYYKMYFTLLSPLFSPHARYQVYLDIKDTQGQKKVENLHDILCNSMWDFDKEIIQRVQQVRSHEAELLQLADLLIGAISYANRGLSSSSAKVSLVERMRLKSGYELTRTTLLREEKVNLFRWRPQEETV
jgi:hypothetical protein